MGEEMLVRYCSPTLAGIKTGNMFTCPYESKVQVIRDIRRLNQRLVPKGLCILPLRYSKGHVLVYVFRPEGLKRDLADEEALSLLKSAGYQCRSTAQCVTELTRRLKHGDAFPHEIGLFLSYPPEDVKGFIENRAGNCKCVGCWKVYGDEQRAREQFLQFDICTKRCFKQWARGVGVEHLTVPERTGRTGTAGSRGTT